LTNKGYIKIKNFGVLDFYINMYLLGWSEKLKESLLLG